MSTYATRNSLRSIRDFSHAMITDLSDVMGKVASLSSRSNEQSSLFSQTVLQTENNDLNDLEDVRPLENNTVAS